MTRQAEVFRGRNPRYARPRDEQEPSQPLGVLIL